MTVAPARAVAGVEAVFVISIPGAAVSGTVAPSVPVVVAPVGVLPLVVAVFTTEPASTSACVSVYLAVAVTDCVGASTPVVPGQEPAGIVSGAAPRSGSRRSTEVRVTLPEFVMTKVYSTWSPATAPPTSAPDFSTWMPGAAASGTSASSTLWTRTSVGEEPEAVAVFAVCPASTSAWVSVYVAVPWTLCPGASRPAAPGQAGNEMVESPDFGSLTPTPSRVTLPLFVTSKV